MYTYIMYDIDKSIKRMLGKSSSKVKPTTPISSFSANWNMRSPSFSLKHKTFNMGKKVKQVQNLAKGSVFFPFTQPTVRSPTGRMIKGNQPSINKVMKKFLGDNDKDGVNNFMDCKVKNPKKHGGELFGKHLQKNIDIETLEPREKKALRRQFEKRPELIKQAKGAAFVVDVLQGRTGQYLPSNYETEPRGRDMIMLDKYALIPKRKREVGIGETLTHELEHRRQELEDPGQAKRLESEYMKVRKRTEGRTYRFMRKQPSEEEKRSFQEKEDVRYMDEYEQIPGEKEAFEAERKLRERDIQPSKEKRLDAYRKLMGDNDGDGVNNLMDCKVNDATKQGWGEKTTVPIIDYPESYGFPPAKRRNITPKEFMGYAQKTGYGDSLTMTPEDYKRRVISKSNLVRIKAGLQSNKPVVPIPYIETRKGVPIEHEGRHRAIAAEELGHKTIPVMFVETEKGWQDNDGDGIINAEDCEPNNPDKQHKRSIRELIEGDEVPDESRFFGPRRQARDDEYWAPMSRGDGKVDFALKKRNPIKVSDIVDIFQSSFLTESEKTQQAYNKGASEQQINEAKRRVRFGRIKPRRY